MGEKTDVSITSAFLKDRELKIAVVRGIFDTGGCVYLERKNNKLYPRLEITTISYNLVRQLSEIFRDLGLRATTHMVKPGKRFNQRRCYKVVIRGELMLHRFTDVVKPQNPKHIAKYSSYVGIEKL